MRGYWIRIVSGAAGVFVVGLAGWYLVAGAKHTVSAVLDSAVSLSIPLPFDLVPFQVDGERMGSLKRLVIHRDAPKEVNWIEVEAQLSEPGQWAELADCQLSIDDFENLDENSSFTCHDELPAGYVEFGEIRFRDTGGESVQFWVPSSVAVELRHANRERIEIEHARMYQRQVRVAEQQARIAIQTSVEVAKVAEAISEAFGDSIRAEVMAELEAAGIRTDGHMTEIRAVDGGMHVEVKSVDSIATAVEVGP